MHAVRARHGFAAHVQAADRSTGPVTHHGGSVSPQTRGPWSPAVCSLVPDTANTQHGTAAAAATMLCACKVPRRLLSRTPGVTPGGCRRMHGGADPGKRAVRTRSEMGAAAARRGRGALAACGERLGARFPPLSPTGGTRGWNQLLNILPHQPHLFSGLCAQNIDRQV